MSKKMIQGDYFKIENAIITDENFDTLEKLLYVILAYYCNNGQRAYPSYETLAGNAVCTRNTIINKMESLVKKEVVNKVSGKNEGSFSVRTNFYTINSINNHEKISENNKILKNYFKVMNAVITAKNIFSDYFEKLLYIILARYCNNGQVCYQPYVKLAKNVGCSEKTVRNKMKSLIDKKLINKVSREGYSNCYTINYEQIEKNNITNVNELPNKVTEILSKVNEIPTKVNEIPSKVNEIPSKVNELPNKEHNIKKHIKNNTLITPLEKYTNEINKLRSNPFIAHLFTDECLFEYFKITDNDFILKKFFEEVNKIKKPINSIKYIISILDVICKSNIEEAKKKEAVKQKKLEADLKAKKQEKIQREKAEQEEKEKQEILNKYNNLLMDEKEKIESTAKAKVSELQIPPDNCVYNVLLKNEIVEQMKIYESHLN